MSQQPQFGGSLPERYDRYLVPLIFQHYAEDIAERVCAHDADAILETACGTGVVTRELLERLPASTRVVATDINPDVLSVAEQLTPAATNLEFRTADASALPFPDQAFDTMVCQFGIMFVPDRHQAYAEAIRLIRPGGRFLFNVWDSLQRNEIPRVAHELLAQRYSENPPDFLTIPFGYNDLDSIYQELSRAGFTQIETHVLAAESQAPSAQEVALALGTGSPLAAQLVEREPLDQALEFLTQALTDHYGPGPIRAPMQAITFVCQTA